MLTVFLRMIEVMKGVVTPTSRVTAYGYRRST